MLRSLKHYWKRLEINGLWSNLKGDIALKMHVGAQNNETFIKPFT